MDKEEVFEIVDFTAVSPFEKLVQSLETSLNKFKLTGSHLSGQRSNQSDTIYYTQKLELSYYRIPKLKDRPESLMRDLLIGT